MAGMRVKYSSLGVRTKINRLRDLPASVAKPILKKGAERISALASDYAPRDTSALEDAFMVMANAGTGTHTFGYRVVIDPSATRTKGKKTESVIQYAKMVHDRYGRPGKGTKAKAAELGVRAARNPGDKSNAVGGRFLERAAIQLKPSVVKELREAVISRARR